MAAQQVPGRWHWPPRTPLAPGPSINLFCADAQCNQRPGVWPTLTHGTVFGEQRAKLACPG